LTASVKVVPLGDLCNVVGGGTPPKDRPDYYGGDIPWATVRDMRTDVISETEFKITKAAVAASATNVIPAGNVVIATRVGLGKVCLIEQPTAINQDLRGVIPRDPQRLTVRYLYWWLKSVAHLIEKEGTGATVQGVKLPFVKSLGLPLRSLAEQRRIVAILDEAFEGIATAKANAEKNLQNARALFASALAKIFGADWPQVRIEDACQSIMDCVNKTAPTVSEATPYKMIRTTNVRNGVVSLDSVNYVAEDVYRVWTRRQVPSRGDVILTREAPMGEVGMLESDELVFLGQRLVSYRAEPTRLDGRFLLYALQSDPLQRQIHSLASGSTVQHMRVPDSKNLQLPLPGLQQQREAVNMLDAMREETIRLGAIYARKIAALVGLKNSLMQQAFSGRLAAEQNLDIALEIA
jgi:type I restriction enzyme S subunit